MDKATKQYLMKGRGKEGKERETSRVHVKLWQREQVNRQFHRMLLLTLQIADVMTTLADVDTQEVLREGWSSRKRLLEKRK